ncbi:MAG: NAD+ synthase [Nitrospirae bacterium]|nr:NAD+ synthase [Nitrospirota bacterium]
MLSLQSVFAVDVRRAQRPAGLRPPKKRAHGGDLPAIKSVAFNQPHPAKVNAPRGCPPGRGFGAAAGAPIIGRPPRPAPGRFFKKPGEPVTRHTVRIAMAQINTAVGAVDDNARKIRHRIAAARALGAHLVSFPELALCGYPPEDLLFHPAFVDAGRRAIDALAAHTAGIVAVVGCVERDAAGHLYNAAAVLAGGRVADVYRKQRLPNYGVFDEKRYFEPGDGIAVHMLGTLPIGISICEDIWPADGPPVRQAQVGGARILVNINASPYHAGKREEREAMLAARATATGAFVCYNNMVGGQDELVFDGQGVIVAPDGTILARGAAFAEELICADLTVDAPARPHAPDVRHVSLGDPPAAPAPAPVPNLAEPLPRTEEIRRALLLGIRDYLGKNGFKKALIGLSGGIDSALVAVLAREALGPENVTCVYMPSRFSSDLSTRDARALAEGIGVRYLELAIEPLFGAYLQTLAGPFKGLAPNEAEENLQSRIRGNLLMALSNKTGALVLTTGNKSEMAVGYATLYGDMAGGFAVIKDLPKQLVYALSRHINRVAGRPVIPESILTREPTAELRADQKDSDSLPPYDVLDPIIEAYVERNQSQDEIVALGFEQDTVRRVMRMVDLAEYKRRQAPPGIRITPRAFGRDRRMPITNRFRE